MPARRVTHSKAIKALNKTMNKIFKLSLLCSALALTACATDTGSRARQSALPISNAAAVATGALAPTTAADGSPVKGSAQRAELLSRAQAEPQIFRRAARPWIGGTLQLSNNDDKLPASFYTTRQFFANKRSGDQVPLSQWAARVTELTQVPVRIAQDVYGSGASNSSGFSAPSGGGQQQVPAVGSPIAIVSAASPTPIRAPVSLQNFSSDVTVPAVDASFDGSLLAHLDHVTNKLSLAWTYEDGTITISRLVTTTYEIDTLPGKTSFAFKSARGANSSTGAAGASGSSANSDSISEAGELDAIGTIESTLKQMISSVPGSTIARSDGSGMLVVTTSKGMQATVRNYVQTENKALNKNVQIQFDVYSVLTDVSNQQGINWNILFNNLTSKYTLGLVSPVSAIDANAGGLSVNILKPSAGVNGDLNRRFGDTKGMLEFLHQFGDSARHTPVSLVSQNRSWIEDGQVQTRRYVSETTPGLASSNQIASTFSLKTDSLTTGDQFAALGFATGTGKVILKYSISFSNLLKLEDFSSGTGANAQRVQLPFLNNATSRRQIVLAPGEVMVLTGLSRYLATNETRSLAENLPVGLGGSQSTSIKREHFAVFVRALALP
jgi:type IVB pilus formation R64 PilN family outer membrane protein